MEGKAEKNSGANSLTNTLTAMMKSIADKPPVLDFGKINSDYSLTLNSFPKPVPKSDYSVCRQLLYKPDDEDVPLTLTYTDGDHDHYGAVPRESHFHKVILPKKMRWLKPNDKVLVAIVQNEFIVIDIVYDAKYLGVKEPNWT